MKFPLLQNEATDFPDVARCPWCKKGKVFEPHSMAILEGGAMLMNRRTACGGSDDRMDAYLQITWHGAHDGGVGDDRELYTYVPIAEDCRGGQFGLYFCSTKCLRAFLNSWVDRLEAQVREQRNAPEKTPEEIEQELRELGLVDSPKKSRQKKSKAKKVSRRRRG